MTHPWKFCHVLRDKSVFTIMTSKGVEMNIMIEYSSILFLKDVYYFQNRRKHHIYKIIGFM